MKTNKLPTIAFAGLLMFYAACFSAQTEKKKATVRIRTVENINGVEKIKDTTYTTDNPGSPGEPTTIVLDQSDQPDGTSRKKIKRIEIIDSETHDSSTGAESSAVAI